MCGFSAVVALHGGTADPGVAGRMADTLHHRGPDDHGLYASGPVAFGFRRLSILDLSPSGHQPFVSDDGGQIVVFNGEIYNYVELRAELIEHGHRFRSTGDTEVLLRAYQQWGRDCLARFNGMWSFLIYDRRRGVVFGSRDRFGVKPLYFHRRRDGVLFASEIKALVASGLYEPRANWRRVAHLLCRGEHSIDPTGQETFYEGISQVRAGSAFELRCDGQTTEWQFWSLDGITTEPVKDPTTEFRELFEDAVRLRMRSDVPVGVSLSGGLDSTSIIMAMARLLKSTPDTKQGARLRAFSYISPQFDESPFIKTTIAETGAELHRLDSDPATFGDHLDEVLWYHDEPLHSAIGLIGFEIYRLASANGVKVVLSGQGADEALGGYPSYFVDYWTDLVKGGALRAAWREIGDYCACHGGDSGRLFREVLERTAKEALRRVPPLRAVAAWRQRGRVATASRWFTRELIDALPSENSRVGNRSLTSALRMSIETGTLPLYLRIEDRNSMAHSVEARLPFLDYRLVSLAFRLPSSWKLRGPWNKYVLREAMRDRIPEVVRARPDKLGFRTPAAEWFRGGAYEVLQDTLASQEARSRGIYNITAIRTDIERHHRGEIEVGASLFDVAQFERWMSYVVGHRGATMPVA